MFCPFCGNNNADGGKFCGKCGKDLQSFARPVPVAAPKTPPVTPRPTPVQKPPRERKPINTAAIKQVCLQLLLALLYLGMAALLLLFFHSIGTVQVAGESASKTTLPEFFAFLTKGNFLFHPTVLSTAVAVGVQVLLYAAPVFCLLAAVGVFLKKKCTALHVSAVVVTVLSAASMALSASLCLWFVPQFKAALSQQLVVLADSIDAVILAPVWVLPAAAVVWIVATSVLLACVNRKKV